MSTSDNTQPDVDRIWPSGVKLHSILGEMSSMNSEQMRVANWKEGLKRAWQNSKAGEDVKDMSQDMINVDSPTTHNHYHPPTSDAGNSTPSTLGTVAKLALGAGLLSTGAGMGVGIPILVDALKDGKQIIEDKNDPPSEGGPRYFLDLGKPE